MFAACLLAMLSQPYDPLSERVTESPRPAVVSKNPPQIITPRNPRVLMFYAEWCGPCHASLRSFKPWLQASGWEVSDSERAHVQLIDVDDFPELANRHNVTLLPTFILIEDDKDLARHVGLATGKTIVGLFDKRSKQPKPVATTPLVTVSGVSCVPWYESINGITSQPSDEHLRHHGFTDEQIKERYTEKYSTRKHKRTLEVPKDA